ncbi:mastermind-like protein 3 [Crotalus tigris]|uniref:mastermind-like protein 3 n=1 Tax=Crotalus tigris TaxID=88082 RepID=UPI00192F1B03|nr:mastermind-like protein 3 [Crotalus tigris]
MGDFPTPAAATNGSSICLNNNLSSSLGGAGIGVNSAPHGPPPGHNATHSGGGGTNGSGGIPKHSTVVERLRQRIEGCRRHHVSCENRYQQAQAEQLELERRDTVSLYQRTLEQRAKKSSSGGGSKQPHSSKQPQDAEPATAEQRNHTLIMMFLWLAVGAAE